MNLMEAIESEGEELGDVRLLGGGGGGEREEAGQLRRRRLLCCIFRLHFSSARQIARSVLDGAFGSVSEAQLCGSDLDPLNGMMRCVSFERAFKHGARSSHYRVPMGLTVLGQDLTIRSSSPSLSHTLTFTFNQFRPSFFVSFIFLLHCSL